MRYIKFPNQIEPDSVVDELVGADEMHTSRSTGIQQVAGRGRAWWMRTYNYVDLSLEEREVVEAFVANAKRGVSAFHVRDPSQYAQTFSNMGGGWIDVFSYHGEFKSAVNSSNADVNSWFAHVSKFGHHVDTAEEIVTFWWKEYPSAQNLRWQGHGTGGHIQSLQVGAAYLHQIKFFNPTPSAAQSTLRASNPESGGYLFGRMPRAQSGSSDLIALPFIVNQQSYETGVVNWTVGQDIGAQFDYADYRFVRCALVVNTENLLPYSVDLEQWSTQTRLSVVSGFGDVQVPDGSGADSAWWALIPDDIVTSTSFFGHSVTKDNDRDWYTFSIWAKAKELSVISLQLADLAGGQSRWTYYIQSLTVGTPQDDTDLFRSFGKIYDVGEGRVRCVLTSLATSGTNIRPGLLVADDDGDVSPPSAGTFNGSNAVLVYGPQLTRHSMPNRYTPTESVAISANSNFWNGSQVVVSGLDPGDRLYRNQRFSIFTQYHDEANNNYTRVEYKRLTRTTTVRSDGIARLHFEPPLRNLPVPDYIGAAQNFFGETAHNAVVFDRPEMRARLVAGTVRVTEKPLMMADVSFTIVEDLTDG